MIEKIVLDYLSEELSPVPVVMEEPKNKVSKFVLIEKTGSAEENHVHTATLAIQSFDTSLYKASELNEAVKEAMFAIVELETVSACYLNTDYNFTDTAEKRYRYQAVFDLYF